MSQFICYIIDGHFKYFAFLNGHTYFVPVVRNQGTFKTPKTFLGLKHPNIQLKKSYSQNSKHYLFVSISFERECLHTHTIPIAIISSVITGVTAT